MNAFVNMILVNCYTTERCWFPGSSTCTSRTIIAIALCIVGIVALTVNIILILGDIVEITGTVVVTVVDVYDRSRRCIGTISMMQTTRTRTGRWRVRVRA
jgi:hypothetical protein